MSHVSFTKSIDQLSVMLSMVLCYSQVKEFIMYMSGTFLFNTYLESYKYNVGDVVNILFAFRGPEGTCFEGGIFPAKLVFPPDYPLSPPKMQFICEMFHPNIYADGRVCISILHAPGDDPMGYESSAERWSPVQSVEKILLSVVSMLAGA